MGINLVSPAGVPWSADYVSVTADPITDLTTDMSAEQRARSGYEHLIQLTNDEDVIKMLTFLYEREVPISNILKNYLLIPKIIIITTWIGYN